MPTINIDQLSNEVLKDIKLFEQATVAIVQDAVDRSAKMTVAELNTTSPKRTGAYAKSWASKKDNKLTGIYKGSRVVYARAPEYRLTHLLEFGHASKNGGRVRGKEHLAPAQETAIKNLKLYIEEGIKAMRE